MCMKTGLSMGCSWYRKEEASITGMHCLCLGKIRYARLGHIEKQELTFIESLLCGKPQNKDDLPQNILFNPHNTPTGTLTTCPQGKSYYYPSFIEMETR